MFRTCAFCNGKLDGDGGPTDLGVGRRLAFDEWKGRLWVICPRCSRWNLAPLGERCGSVMALRARHLERARLTTTTREGMALLLTCPSCGAEGTMLTGADAQLALRRGLTYLNLARGGRQRAEDAARLVEAAGGPHRLIHDVARRDLTLRSLAPDRRLALEMAVDERAEVEELERQWKEAEEIAEIADGMLSADPTIDEELRRLRERLDKKKER